MLTRLGWLLHTDDLDEVQKYILANPISLGRATTGTNAAVDWWLGFQVEAYTVRIVREVTHDVAQQLLPGINRRNPNVIIEMIDQILAWLARGDWRGVPVGARPLRYSVADLARIYVRERNLA